jgi:hypothetical protein
MNIWREIKKQCIYLAIFLLERYVDMYLWLNKQEYVTAFFQKKIKCIEPEKSEWIGIYSLIYNHPSNYNLYETFIDDYKSIEDEYKCFCNKTEYLDTTEVEHLFVAKKDDTYISCSYYPSKDISFLKSDVEFTYIEYCHPNMRYTIELVIPEGMWIVGNELFSPAFILRLLQQQSRYYYFDMAYKLNMIDHEIQEIILSSDKYILLDKNSYMVHSIHLGK